MPYQRTTCALQAFLLALTFLCLSSSVRGQTDPLDYVSIVPITDNLPETNELGRDRVSINSTPFKNQSLLTAGDYQVVPYYRDDGKLLIARRNITNPTDPWDIRATEFTSYNINDAHNVPSMGIDGAGYLHISWGMHGNDLLYTRSSNPVTDTSPMSLVGDTVGNSAAINTMTGSHETRVTYPNFFGIPGTPDLLFNYRTGGSGNGTYRISRYDTSTGEWSFTDESWLENTDSRGLTYNAYPHNLSYDSGGGLHASWTFRYNASSPTGHSGFQTNHNLMYAYSPDDGATWYRDIGGTIPYTGVIDDITSEVIVPIPEGSSLINTGTQAIDAHQRPAIATWWAPHAHDDVPDHRRQYMYVGHDGSRWFTSQITHRTSDNPSFAIPENQLGVNHMGRPQIVFDDYNRAYVIYKDADRGGGITVAVSQADSRDDWELIDLTTTNLGYYEPTIDLALWERSRQLHILVQTIDNNSSNGGSPMSIVEWDAAAAMGRVVKWTGASSATWNAADDNFAHLGTATSFDSFDNVTFDGSTSETDIHFAGDITAGKVVVDSSGEYTFSGPGALTKGSLSVVGGGTLNLATSGNTYTGPTRVSNATLKITGDATAMTSPIIAADGGTVVMDAIDAAGMASRFEVWPTGVLEIGTHSSTGNVFPDNPVGILNDGIVRVRRPATLGSMSGMGAVDVVANTTFAANPQFAGSISVGSGGVALASTADGLGSPSAHVSVTPGGQLQLTTSGVLPPQLELAGNGGGSGALHVASNLNITVAGGVTLAVGQAAVDVGQHSEVAIAKPVTGLGGLTKQGPGTLRLSALNTYAGPTIVEAGTLVLDTATGPGDTTVASGATLEGGGAVRGSLSAESGSVVRVRPSAGLADGVIYEERFSGSASAPLNGRPPDTTSGGYFWTAHPAIPSDGVGVSVPAGSSATLPLDVEDGYRYMLDATFLNVTGDSDWLAIGFVQDLMNGGTSNGNRFIQAPTTGKAWMLFRGDNTSSENQTLLGSASSGTLLTQSWADLNNNGGDIHLRVLLDTTAGAGNYTAEFLAKEITDIEYTSLGGPWSLVDENISAVGFAVSHSDVAGDVDFFRLRREGDEPVDPDALVIQGDFHLDPGATLEMEIRNTGDYDRLRISREFRAEGTLKLSLSENASPLMPGDTFNALDFGELVGLLELLELPSLPAGLVWNNAQFLTDGILRVDAGIAGDFNGDHVVDVADYTLWRDSAGASGAGLAADGNGDLHVDRRDYQLWRSQFGNSAAPANSTRNHVPEAPTHLLLIAACMAPAIWSATLRARDNAGSDIS